MGRDPFFHGYHLSGSWAVTGEMRGYRKRSGIFNPLPVARPVNQGGWGTLETAFRYSRLDLADGAVDGGEMDIYSSGSQLVAHPVGTGRGELSVHLS